MATAEPVDRCRGCGGWVHHARQCVTCLILAVGEAVVEPRKEPAR